MPVDETFSTSPTELFTPDENFIDAQQDFPPDPLCPLSDSDADASSDLSQFDDVEADLIPPPPDTFSSNSCYDQNLVEKFEAVQHRQSYRLHLIHDAVSIQDALWTIDFTCLYQVGQLAFHSISFLFSMLCWQSCWSI